METTANEAFCAVCGRKLNPGQSQCPDCAQPGPLPEQAGVARAPAVIARRKTVLEILLEPRSIHWMLISGGVLLVIGLVIWLASLGVFKNPCVVAGCIGGGTLVLL